MADILIRMEMPKSCGFCELRYFDGDADCCPFVGDACGYGTRHVDCPLHELPEHGDLIDRDAVLDGECDIISSDGYYAEFGFSRDMLRCMPAIVPSNKEDTE